MTENESYETGYADGESSGYADWINELSEEFDIPMSEIDGPSSFIAKLKERYKIERR